MADNPTVLAWLRTILPGYSLGGTLIAAGILVFFYSLYSGCETGLYRVNRLRLHLAYRRQDRRARILDELLEDPQALIAIFVLGANLCGYLIANLLTIYMNHRGYSAHEIEFWSTVILTPVFAVFCETVPKNCFFFRANALMLLSAPFIRLSFRAAQAVGLAWLLRAFSQWVLKTARAFGRAAVPGPEADDLGTLLRESLAASPFSEIQGGIAERLLALPDIPLGRAVIPLARTVALPMSISRRDFIEALRRQPHSRIPLYEGHPRNIVGMVNLYQVLAAADRPPRDFLRPVPKISTEHRLLDALTILRENSIRMAAVVDRQGSAIGIVTIRDLLEEVFGDTE